MKEIKLFKPNFLLSKKKPFSSSSKIIINVTKFAMMEAVRHEQMEYKTIWFPQVEWKNTVTKFKNFYDTRKNLSMATTLLNRKHFAGMKRMIKGLRPEGLLDHTFISGDNVVKWQTRMRYFCIILLIYFLEVFWYL